MTSGHYTCSVKSSHSGDWTLIDDDEFRGLSKDNCSIVGIDNQINSNLNYIVGFQAKGLTDIREVSEPENWPYASNLVKKVTMSEESCSFKNSSTLTKDVSRQNSISDDGQIANWIRVFVPDEDLKEKEKLRQLPVLEEDSAEHSGYD